MPYALIPEGFALKKVTKAQAKAVDEKRWHEDVKVLLANDIALTAILAPIIAGVTGAAGVLYSKYVIAKLEEKGTQITEATKKEIEEGVRGVQTGVGVLQEAVETGRIGASVGAPVTIAVEDLPEMILKEGLKRLGWDPDKNFGRRAPK